MRHLKDSLNIYFFKLKKEYERTIKTNSFHKRIDFVKNQSVEVNQPISIDEKSKPNLEKSHSANEEAFVFHSTGIMLHFTQATMLDEFGNLNVGFIK